jgi:hypothetical protein
MFKDITKVMDTCQEVSASGLFMRLTTWIYQLIWHLRHALLGVVRALSSAIFRLSET